MKSIHFLITYQCTRSCPHCFVWGSPNAHGVFDDGMMRDYLRACRGLDEVWFEGGEPMLYRELVCAWTRYAADLGLRAGVVSNGYWATNRQQAERILRELQGCGLTGLMISTDDYHGAEVERAQATTAAETARDLGIPTIVAVTQREDLMYRGRAASCLAREAALQPPADFKSCPHESLDQPERVHVDHLGYVHLCQGLTIGRAADGGELAELVWGFDAQAHPIVRRLLAGGPHELARYYGLPLAAGYADACNLCYASRSALRRRFPEYLAPDHLYGEGLCSRG